MMIRKGKNKNQKAFTSNVKKEYMEKDKEDT